VRALDYRNDQQKRLKRSLRRNQAEPNSDKLIYWTREGPYGTQRTGHSTAPAPTPNAAGFGLAKNSVGQHGASGLRTRVHRGRGTALIPVGNLKIPALVLTTQQEGGEVLLSHQEGITSGGTNWGGIKGNLCEPGEGNRWGKLGAHS